MLRFSGAGFIFLQACNFKCGHCLNSSLPDQSTACADDEILDNFLKASDLFGKDFCFTGGEVTLNMEKLLPGIEKAKKSGCSVNMVTNSSWAIDDDFTRERLTALKEAGLFGLCASYDLYHSSCDTDLFEKVRRVVTISKELGLDVVVRYCSDSFGDKLLDKAKELSALSSRDLEQTTFEKLAPYGRAKNLFVKRAVAFDDLRDGICGLVQGPAAYVNGTVYACCGASLGANRKGPLVLGDLRKESAQDILSRALKDDILNALLAFGPKWLLGKLSEKSRNRVLEKLWHNGNCQACRRMLDDLKIVAELREILPEYRKKILATVAGCEWKRGVRGQETVGNKAILQESFDDFVIIVSTETELGHAVEPAIYEALKLMAGGATIETTTDILWAKYGRADGLSGEEALGLVKSWEIQLKDLKLL